MTDREALIRTYIARQKDHADMQQKFKNSNSKLTNMLQ